MAKHNIVRDPDNLHAQLDLKRPAPELKLAAAFDLGTSCGLGCTWFEPGKPWVPGARPIYGGQLDLSVGDYDSGAIRFVRFRQLLDALDPDIVFFENVHGAVSAGNFGPHPSVAQVVNRVARPIELIGSYKCTLGTYCEDRNIPCVGFSIQAIKRRATNKGNANKEQIIRAANAEFGAGLEVEDYDKTGADNIADALYCLALGLEQYSRGVPPTEADAREVHGLTRKRPRAASPR